jgi:hypothetical protein
MLPVASSVIDMVIESPGGCMKRWTTSIFIGGGVRTAQGGWTYPEVTK